MTIVPIREIASVGVIKDLRAQELPPNAWTSANNVRFINGAVRRSPVFRTLLSTLLTTTPYSIHAANPQSAPDAIFYSDFNGKIYRRTTAGLHADVSALAHVDVGSTQPVTYASLAEITIANRNTEQPWYLDTLAVNFVALPGWTSTWTAAAVRVYKDFIVALNVTKTGTQYPYMVKTSDASVGGAIPTSWDHTDPTKLATENNFSQMTTPLVDGQVLGDDMMLYTTDDVWKMSYRGDDNIFDYRSTGIGKGVINVNCVKQAKRLHYVFGTHDIYIHDSMQATSIADQRVREYVYKHIDRSNVDRCYTFHDERHNTMWFAFVSNDPECLWLNTTQCNRAVGFNYENNTWSFADLPNSAGAVMGNPSSILSWSSVATTWTTSTGAWLTSSDTPVMIPVMIAGVTAGTPAVSASALYVFDLIEDDEAFISALPVDTAITPAALLRHVSADVDQLGLSLVSYKNIRSMFPQIESDGTFQIRFGSQMLPNEAITWSAYQTFDPSTDYKADTMTGGRLVSFELKFTDVSNDFSLTAIDLDLTSRSKK